MSQSQSPNKITDFQLEVEAGKRANADPLPGPMATAFGTQNIVLFGFTVRPVVAYDWAIMKHINSPVYRQMLEFMQAGDKAETIDPEYEDIWDLVYLLTRPCEEADKVFKKGKEAFHEEAKKEIGFKLDLGRISILYEACITQLREHTATMVRYAGSPEEGNGHSRDFMVAEVRPETASAGS